MSRRLRFALQMTVAAALLAWLAATSGWEALGHALASAPPALCALLLGMYYVNVALSCWKWTVLLRVEGLHVPLGRLFRWYLVGAFAGNFLPTEVGGDLGRGLLAGRATGRPLAVARSILLERLSGLAVLLALALAGVATLLGRPALAAAGLALGIGVLALGFTAARATGLPRPAAGLFERLPARVRRALADTAAAAPRYLGRPGHLAAVAALSVAFQLLAGVGAWLNLWATGARLPLGPTILAAAIAGVAGLLPVTVNGWGVREGLLVALLTPLGASPGAVLAGALLGRALNLIATLPGGVLLMLERRPEAAPSAGMRDEG